MFAYKDNEIVDGPETLWCSGHSDDNKRKHLFLKAEGYETCCNEECKSTLCPLCNMKSADDKKYCCGCYVEEVVDTSYDGPTFEEMKAQIGKHNKEHRP